jgi:molybdenum cofactor cytidylyltransferase
MEQDKLLLPIEDVPVVEWVVRSAVHSRLDECILVYRNTAVRDIGTKHGLRTVHNEYAEWGQSASVKLGVTYAKQSACGFLFLVGDQPFVQPEIINERGRAIMARMPNRVVEVPFEDNHAGIDIDTPESYRSIVSI